MVNFDSITIGLEVEFQVEDGSIERGIVRYKGPVNGKPGDWVGVEANRSGILLFLMFSSFTDDFISI